MILKKGSKVRAKRDIEWCGGGVTRGGDVGVLLFDVDKERGTAHVSFPGFPTCLCYPKDIEPIERGGSMSKTFYLVWREGGSVPVRIHDDLQIAKEEAKRLCQKEKRLFYILKAVEKVSPAPTPIVWEKCEEEYEPF